MIVVYGTESWLRRMGPAAVRCMGCGELTAADCYEVNAAHDVYGIEYSTSRGGRIACCRLCGLAGPVPPGIRVVKTLKLGREEYEPSDELIDKTHPAVREQDTPEPPKEWARWIDDVPRIHIAVLQSLMGAAGSSQGTEEAFGIAMGGLGIGAIVSYLAVGLFGKESKLGEVDWKTAGIGFAVGVVLGVIAVAKLMNAQRLKKAAREAEPNVLRICRHCGCEPADLAASAERMGGSYAKLAPLIAKVNLDGAEAPAG